MGRRRGTKRRRLAAGREATTASELYTAENDHTLTAKQAEQGGFMIPDGASLDEARTIATLRSRTSKVDEGGSSGFHEAVVTTDMFDFLKKATKSSDGKTYTLASGHRLSSKYKGQVSAETYETVMELADAYRTDTAQTILTSEAGTAAGHSGSNVNTTGQSKAHDLLREAVIGVLKLDPEEDRGITKDSIATFFSALTVTSISPGEVARTIPTGTRSLKAGARAKDEWEVKRNSMKNKVKGMMEHLTIPEQDFVNDRIERYLESAQRDVPRIRRRRIDRRRGTSPMRTPRLSRVRDEVQGGSYANHSLKPRNPANSYRVPKKHRYRGMDLTMDFRGRRR